MGINVRLNRTPIRSDELGVIGERVRVNLSQEGDRAVKGISDVLRKGAEDIKELARSMAPFRNPGDHGGSTDMDHHLDRAIDVKETTDSNRRLALTVFINGRKLGNDNKKIAQYAFLIHEGLTPYGSGEFKASDGTLGKGPQAGGKFMERAYKELYKKILSNAVERTRKVFGK